MALGPGVPDPPRGVPAPLRPHRHPLSASRAVVAKPVLNGLHHDYSRIPANEGLPELVIEHLRPDLQ
jgi:hypothetical protein